MPRKAKPRVKAGNSQSAAAKRKVAFAHAYIANNHNATEAAKAAGFSPHSAYSRGLELVKNRDVQQMIADLTAPIAAAAGLSIERTLKEVERLSFSDIRKFLNPNGSMKSIHELDDDSAAALAGLDIDSHVDGEGEDATLVRTTKFKLWDKNTALEKAMKHLGLYERDNLQRGESLAIQVVLGK